MSGAGFNMEADIGGERAFNTEADLLMEADVGGGFHYGDGFVLHEGGLSFLIYVNSVILCRRS